ncbi:Protein of unknown function [Paenibacillus sp. UNCCL117]|uniref:DUF3048 domain-containing protein n=1 Tax=unclassified Paenibacillus TaxID=185978 RepID=UPI00087E0F06|nr:MULTISPECIES: DUF3048 domain-containing protein [unclassified Paenibacillus]SDE08347.1 Protein of unknown function [Paenibacillus sp. cl123]SFW58980.1 Protein of unknown function [Paenibacillus sp. UNCCL117]
MKEDKRSGSRTMVVLLACLLAWAAAGCSPDGAPAATVPEQEPGGGTVQPVTPVIPAPKPEPAYAAPLTGMKIPSPNEVRPVMVVVNNAPQARPQSGLSQADLLFEVLAEGEITRLIAFYQSRSTTDPVGPVRSIRPYFISLGKGYGAVQVHAGGSPDGYETIRRQKIENLDEITNAGTYFWREKSRKAPHNLYTSIDSARQGADKRGFPGQGNAEPVYSFLQTPEAAAASTSAGTTTAGTTTTGAAVGLGGVDASRIDITFLLKSYLVSYEYDQTTSSYKRFIDKAPHIDLNNGEALQAANVIVMGAEHRVLDREGRRDVKLTGSGPALLFQQGKAITIEWRREQENSPVRWYEQGREVALVPGQTHVMIVPKTPTFEEHVVY